MTTTPAVLDVTIEEGYEPYRAVSRGAIVSLVLSVFSVAALAFPSMLILALIGFVLGLAALRQIRLYPLELTGRAPALIGAAVSGLVFAGGAAFHSYNYATEVPDGYQRISFANLQPVAERPDLPVSPESLELNGEKIFVKGYVYPDGQKNNIKRFILVPDMGTCCFGGQPKLTDMIEVTLAGGHRINYSLRKRKLGGVLRVDTALKPVSGVNGVFYQLEADHVQ
jgi:hypothetical protein